jgi:two-component system chemotaxis response regulator CheY
VKALIVDDDFTSRNLLQKILSPYGEVDIAANGAEAVEAFSKALAQEKPYKLICMDIMMPGMNGIEALKRIRDIERQKNISGKDESLVVMVTALDDQKSIIESYYKSGANSYITKPIDRKLFLEMLKNTGLIA